MLHGNNALAGQIFDFLSAVFFPVLDIRVGADTEWATLEDYLCQRRFPEQRKLGSEKWEENGVHLTVKMIVRTLSSNPDVRTAS